jgi:hypothetical protein
VRINFLCFKSLNSSFISRCCLSLWLLTSVACGAKFLKVENAKELTQIKEYEQLLVVKEIPQSESAVSGQSSVTPSAGQVEVPPSGEKQSAAEKFVQLPTEKAQPTTSTKKSKPKANSKVGTAKPVPTPIVNLRRQPEIEDDEGFSGRRPIMDPMRVGEKVVLNLSWYKFTAGELVIEVLPFVEVNGRKCYHFRISGRSNSFFSSIYSVDDYADTYVDYETLIPYNYEVHVKETKQIRQIRSFFDWEKLEARFWEKKVTPDYGVETKEQRWSIVPFSQNVISAFFYLRFFQLNPGKEIKFPVADDQKNMIVTGKVLRREKLETDVGVVPAVLMQPQVQVEGTFKPMGEIFFWLSDDDRKQFLRIESKIRIGTIVGTIKSRVKPD